MGQQQILDPSTSLCVLGPIRTGLLRRKGRWPIPKALPRTTVVGYLPVPGLKDSETPKNFSIATFLLVAHPQTPPSSAQPELSEGGTGRTVGGAPKDHAHSTAFRSWSELLPPATRAQILNRR